MARALAILFASGATLVAMTLLLPHDANTDAAPIWAAVASAYLVAGALWSAAARLSVALLHALLFCGTALISVCVIAGGTSASAYPLMYLWVSLYAYFFFRGAAAAAHVGSVAVLFAVALSVQDDTPLQAIHWLMAIGTVSVGGVLIGRLAGAVRAQAADLAAVSRMSGALGDLAQDTCESLRRSTRADAAALIAADLSVRAMAGAAEAGLVFATDGAREALRACLSSGRAGAVPHAARGAAGWAHPVLRDGKPVAILVVGWTRPRLHVADRVRASVLLFAAETSHALRRAERQAMAINDNIVQGLLVARHATAAGEREVAVTAIDTALEHARALIAAQLPDEGDIRPGDLVRGS